MESADIAQLRNEKYNASVASIHKSHSDLYGHSGTTGQTACTSQSWTIYPSGAWELGASFFDEI